MAYDIGKIRELITEACTDDGLQNLAMDNFLQVHSEFTTGQTKSERVRLLVEYAEKHNEIPKLLEAIKKDNPKKYSEYEPELARKPGKKISTEEEQVPRINIRLGILTSFLAFLVVMVLRSNGLLETIELLSYDAFLRQGPKLSRDTKEEIKESLPQVSVIEISSEYLESDSKIKCSEFICDKALLELLESIKEIQPDALIGFDIYRDLEEQTDPDLLDHLNQHSNIILACFAAEKEDYGTNILIDNAEDRIGFVNYPPDYPDENRLGQGARRYLLLTSKIPSLQGSCRTHYSLALQLAKSYLQGDLEVRPDENNPEYIEIGENKLRPLVRNYPGGYHPERFVKEGFQVLQNYNIKELVKNAPSPQDIINQAEIFRNIDGNPNLGLEEKNLEKSKMRDDLNLGDILFIGYALDDDWKDNDLHDTPIGTMPGVYLHAIALQQLLLEYENPQNIAFIETIDRLEETILIFVTSILGGIFIIFMSHQKWKLIVSMLILSIATGFICFYAFVSKGFWLPFIPIQLSLALMLMIVWVEPLAKNTIQKLIKRT